jgi:NADPH:quinone reductase-like Zn-dependent oxidoreductase
MSQAPSDKMLSISIPAYSKPSGYKVAQFPKPVVNADTDVIIKVHAASINPVDVKRADGIMKMVVKDKSVLFSHLTKDQALIS